MYGRSCGQVVVAHIRRPRALSKNFLGIFLLRASSCSCCCSLSSLPAAKVTVSKSKLKVHPHQVISWLSCAFFQLIGAFDSREEAEHEGKLLHKGSACEQCKQVVDIDPGSVGMLAEQGVRYAEKHCP